jgi:hypothetical protein
MTRIEVIIFLIFSLVPFSKAFATGQIPDLLIYNGETLQIFANPLEKLYENDSAAPNLKPMPQQ